MILSDLLRKPKNLFRILLSTLFIGCSGTSFAQDQHEIDSLQKVLPSLTVDSSKIKALNNLSAQMVDVDPSKALEYANEALKIARSSNYKKLEAQALQNIGNGNYNLAEYKVALSYYIEALHIHETIGSKRGILSAAGSIGNVFLDLKQPNEAQPYFMQALEISKEIKSKVGEASSLIALGTVLSEKKECTKALEYDFQALKLFEEMDNKEAVATSCNNIADCYQNLNDMKKAMLYIDKAYSTYEEIGNVYGMALALNNMGSFYDTLGNNEKALLYYKKGLGQGMKIGANDRILASYKGLYTAHKKLGNFKEALAVNELYQATHNLIYNTENSKHIAEMQTRFDTERKAKEIDLLTKDKMLKEDQLIKQRLITWSIALGGGIVFLLALGAAWAYVQKRKVNNQLAIKNEKIESAYNIIENQHKDIKDSIKYAQRLQEAILPTEEFNNTFRKKAFVLFKPKDIVSGDFYWIDEIESGGQKQILFAAVDCTGHGVPGAFMSIVGHNLLNQAVNEHHKTNPAEILNELNIALSETLHQTVEESTVKDGMDIALCSLKKNNSNSYTLQFAGANNPVWIISSGQTQKLQEIKGDKFPVGIFVGEELNKFKNHEVEVFPGDTLYVFTDGFADQFGGAKGKKFKYKPLQELILSIQDLPMQQQCEKLNKTLIDWKGNLEQVDDVCIVGVKI